VVVLIGEDQKIMSWSGTAAGLFGVPAAQALGKPAADVAGHPRTLTGLGGETLAALVAAEGGWSGSLLCRRRDGSEFMLQATGLRVALQPGTGTLWISHVPGQDSDQRALGEALALAAAERRRLTLIAEAGKLFGSSLDLDVVLDLVVTKTAQALGDRCVIRLLDASGEFLLPTAAHHNDAQRAQEFEEDSVHGRPSFPGADQASARHRRPPQRVRAGRIENPGQDWWPSSRTPHPVLPKPAPITSIIALFPPRRRRARAVAPQPRKSARRQRCRGWRRSC
jgi:hypothetical protein